jgi:hypothetical protein
MLVPMRVRSMQKTAQHKPSAARVRQIHRPPSNLSFDEAAATYLVASGRDPCRVPGSASCSPNRYVAPMIVPHSNDTTAEGTIPP